MNTWELSENTFSSFSSQCNLVYRSKVYRSKLFSPTFTKWRSLSRKHITHRFDSIASHCWTIIWLRVWNIELTLAPSLQIKPRKHSAGKHTWQSFWKTKDCGRTAKARVFYPEAAIWKHVWRNLFFDQVKLFRSATSLKTRSSRRCILVNFVKFVKTTFLQKTTGRLLLIKGALSGLRQFFATENPLKMMKNTFFSPQDIFVLKISKFLSWHFGHVSKRLD